MKAAIRVFKAIYCICTGLFMLGWGVSFGQCIEIESRAGAPSEVNPSRFDWHFNAVYGKVWVYENQWREVGGNKCTSVKRCNNFMLIDRKITTHLVQDIRVADTTGRILIAECEHASTSDSTIIAWIDRQGLGIVMNIHGDTLAKFFSCFLYGGGFHGETILGKKAFCLIDHVTQVPTGSCEELRSWGMLGMDGKWLIQPKFDEPFRFENGTAEVLYYGQKRKINEKGEFVE